MKNLQLKFTSLIFVLLLLVWVSGAAQTNAAIIKLTNGPEFNRQSVISYQVQCSPNGYYYVGLEKFINGQWREIMLDISLKSTSKEAVLKRAVANGIAPGQLSVQHIPAAYLQPHNGLYRLKLTYGPSPAVISKVVLSKEFTVKKN